MSIVWASIMLWLWLGFFAMVAALLSLHRKNAAPTVRSSIYWGLGYGALGLLFAAVVYFTFEHGPTLVEARRSGGTGVDAAAMYLSAYLVECALSFDTAFVICLLFQHYRVRSQVQPRLLWWALVSTIVLRVLVLVGSGYLAKAFDGVLYLFGGLLIVSAISCLRDDRDDDDDQGGFASWIMRRLRTVRGDHGGKYLVDGALTAGGVCLLAIIFAELSYASEAVAALSISRNTFIVVTSNVMATMTMHSLYFVLVSMNADVRMKHLRLAIGALLLLTGAKMLVHNHLVLPPVATLALVVFIIGAGITASMFANRNEARRQ